MNNEEKEIVSNIVKDNKNLFINLDAIVRGRIIDKIKNNN